MAKSGGGFEQYIHDVLELDALATRYHAETADHHTRVRESQEVGDALRKRFSAAFGVAVSEGESESWLMEGGDTNDTEAEIGRCRRKVAHSLNVAEEIRSLEETVRSALSTMSRGFEIGQRWATLAESTLAKGEGGDSSEDSCDQALEKLDGYKAALTEVVRLHRDMISAHQGFASVEQRVSALVDAIRGLISKRPCRLPEMET
jgi:hypothetical protein